MACHPSAERHLHREEGVQPCWWEAPRSLQSGADRPPPPHSRLQAPSAVSPGLIHPDSWSWKDNWWVIAFACGWLVIGGFLRLGPPEANLERRIQGQVVPLGRDPRSPRLEEYRSKAGRGREEENQQSVLLSPVLLWTMAVQPLCPPRNTMRRRGTDLVLILPKGQEAACLSSRSPCSRGNNGPQRDQIPIPRTCKYYLIGPKKKKRDFADMIKQRLLR